MRWNRVLATTFLGLIFTAPLRASECELSPLVFEGDSLTQMLRTVGSPIEGDFEQMPIVKAVFRFGEPTYRDFAAAETVDLFLDLTLDARSVPATWKKTVYDRAHKRGCDTRTRWAEGFGWKVVSSGAVEAKFRVKKEDWSCGTNFFGGMWKNRNWRVDATVWQTLRAEVRDGGENLVLGMRGRYEDNVDSRILSFVKAFGNIASLEPISSFILNIDEKIFASLKHYRDAVEEIERFREYGSHQITLFSLEGGRGQTVKLDLVHDPATAFRQAGQNLYLESRLRSREERSFLPSQACRIREVLDKARIQTERVGPGGVSHVVRRGDNAWSIAEHYYADGRYFQLLVASNGLEDPSQLSEGQELQVSPLGKFLRDETVELIATGESVWSTSGPPSGGDVRTFAEALDANQLPDSDLVYPLQVLKVVGPEARP